VADVILTTEKDRERANPLFCLIHFKPMDGRVDRQMSQAWPQTVVTLASKLCRTQPVGFLPNAADAVLAIVQCGFNIFAKAAVAPEQVVEDQGEITLGFRRELNSEPHVRGASQ
jgi:hypothetical protein